MKKVREFAHILSGTFPSTLKTTIHFTDLGCGAVGCHPGGYPSVFGNTDLPTIKLIAENGRHERLPTTTHSLFDGCNLSGERESDEL